MSVSPATRTVKRLTAPEFAPDSRKSIRSTATAHRPLDIGRDGCHGIYFKYSVHLLNNSGSRRPVEEAAPRFPRSCTPRRSPELSTRSPVRRPAARPRGPGDHDRRVPMMVLSVRPGPDRHHRVGLRRIPAGGAHGGLLRRHDVLRHAPAVPDRGAARRLVVQRFGLAVRRHRGVRDDRAAEISCSLPTTSWRRA